MQELANHHTSVSIVLKATCHLYHDANKVTLSYRVTEPRDVMLWMLLDSDQYIGFLLFLKEQVNVDKIQICHRSG